MSFCHPITNDQGLLSFRNTDCSLSDSGVEVVIQSYFIHLRVEYTMPSQSIHTP